MRTGFLFPLLPCGSHAITAAPPTWLRLPGEAELEVGLSALTVASCRPCPWSALWAVTPLPDWDLVPGEEVEGGEAQSLLSQRVDLCEGALPSPAHWVRGTCVVWLW